MGAGTPAALRPITEEVLAWVARQRVAPTLATPDDVRRIELCAMATREAAMFFDLYGAPKTDPNHAV